MKSIITFSLFFFAVFCVNAQDVMSLKNGSQMTVFVSEVTPTVIKFKKSTDGPTYSMNLVEIISITYSNGSTETFGAAPKVAITKNDDLKDDLLSPSKRYGGPRVGVTYLQKGTSRDRIAEAFNRGAIQPVITQFGWQFETQIFKLKDGSKALFEFVPMIGGLEQGLFLPSATTMFGYRTKRGLEFGMGPSLSLSGVGVSFAAGFSFKSGGVTFPINVVFSPSIAKTTVGEDAYTDWDGTFHPAEPGVTSHSGSRVSLIIGFSTYKR